MFQLTDKEYDFLISQFVISNKKSSRGGNRHAPYAFTEQGIAMLSSVLRSDRAIKVNIEIMRTFIKIRKMLVTNEKLKQQLDQLEKRYDKQFEVVFEAIRQLMEPEPTKDKKPIGFAPWPEEE